MIGFRYSQKFKDAVEEFYPKNRNKRLWDNIDFGNIAAVGKILEGYYPTTSLNDLETVTTLEELNILKSSYARDKKIKALYKHWKFEVSDYIDEDEDEDDFIVTED